MVQPRPGDTMPDALRVVSAGAARELVDRLAVELGGDTVSATFGPVGVVRAAVRSGDGADVVITSAGEMARLAADRLVDQAAAADLGAVPTALAVRTADAAPDLSAGLEPVLAGSDAVYCPDLDRSTAGAHLWSVLQRMDLTEAMRPRLRVFPHGAAAMAALAESVAVTPVGCTQLTEILATPGVRAIGEIPPPWGLRTVYRVAQLTGAARPDLARYVVALLAAAGRRDLRTSLGFASVGADGQARCGDSSRG